MPIKQALVSPNNPNKQTKNDSEKTSSCVIFDSINILATSVILGLLIILNLIFIEFIG